MRPGEHSTRGWAVAAGNGIEVETNPAGDVVDLSRTILGLLGLDDDTLIGRPLIGRPVTPG
jgi:hypothetical protein